ncbi:MAG: NTP transferase domain-containing protein [Planctomycetota bacterium]
MVATTRPLAVAVLAAGHGKRLGSDRPKVLTPVLGRPSVSYVLRVARALEPQRIAVVIGRGGEEVRACLRDEPGIEFVEQRELLGTGHALLQAARLLGSAGDVVVLYGDSPLVPAPLLENVVRTHRAMGAQATMVTAELACPTGYGRVIRDAAGKVARIVEEKDADEAARAIREVNTGISCFRLEGLIGDLECLDDRNAQREYYLTDLFGRVRERGLVVAAVRAGGEDEVLGFNSADELAVVRELMRRRIVARHIAAGVDIPAPQTVVIDDTVEVGRDSRILPFCVMTGRIRIGSRCEVGPFSHLRDGTVLEDGAEIGNFVEVKKSRVGARTKAKHLTYLGDAEIGADANIGAGTITANYDGKKKHRTLIGDGAFIGSGTVLVAPVEIGKKAVTGAGAVVLRGRDVPPGGVVVGVPARELAPRGGEKGGSPEGATSPGSVPRTPASGKEGAPGPEGGDPP